MAANCNSTRLATASIHQFVAKRGSKFQPGQTVRLVSRTQPGKPLAVVKLPAGGAVFGRTAWAWQFAVPVEIFPRLCVNMWLESDMELLESPTPARVIPFARMSLGSSK